MIKWYVLFFTIYRFKGRMSYKRKNMNNKGSDENCLLNMGSTDLNENRTQEWNILEVSAHTPS